MITAVAARWLLTGLSAAAAPGFPSLAAYEQYRAPVWNGSDFIEADHIRDESGCVLRYQRTFMRPVLPEVPAKPTR